MEKAQPGIDFEETKRPVREARTPATFDSRQTLTI